MEPERNELAALFPNVAAQMRSVLSSLHLAATQLVPASHREVDPDLDRRAALLDKNYYQLLRLTNNLSMAACLADGRPLAMQDRELVELVGELSEKVASLATLLDVKVRFVCAHERLICAVAADVLEQILEHLLSNALKFTPAGGTVTVELCQTEGRVLIRVEDTGCGIPQERLEILFEGYRREKIMDLPMHGLGLGLPLCRKLAESHDGTLMAESYVGKGSRFTLSIPYKQEGKTISDVPFDYGGGFNRTLLALADALPAEAFLLRSQE